MEFLRTPDIAAAQRWSSLTPGSINVAKSATTPAAHNGAPQRVITPARNASPSAATPANPAPTPQPSAPLDRAGIKNSFQSLFSPNVSSTPALLSRPSPTAPGLTPFINGMVTPCLIPPGSSFMPTYPHMRTPAANPSPAHPDAMLSSPYLQAAAKEAVRREFLNMPSLVSNPADLTPNSERVVPGSSNPPSAAQTPQQLIVTNDGVAVPTASQSKPDNSPCSDTNTSEASRTVPQGPKQHSPSQDKDEQQSGKTANVPQQIHPQMLQPQSHPPPGMVMFGQPPHMVMAPPPTAMYAPPPGMMMFPGAGGQPVMSQHGMMIHPGHPAAQMVPPTGPPVKPETPAERKERIEVEKQELIREFKKKTREAALVRFRQKRRERRFGKLIRYDCRKKLADARPRVKGRFVRIKADDDDESEGPQVVPNLDDM